MSNHKYTPTTEEIRKSYIGEPTHFMDQLVGAEFDRWLAAEIAAAEQRGASRALRDAADDLEPGDQHESPYVKAGRDIIRTLRQRADYYHLQHRNDYGRLEADDA